MEPAADFRPHRVVVLALDGLLPFELGIPHRIFGRPRDAGGRRLYEVVTCSVRPPGPGFTRRQTGWRASPVRVKVRP